MHGKNKADRFSIGQEWDSGPTASDFWKGQIDEVQVWNVLRTPAQIQAAMLQPLTGTESGLVGYWPLRGNARDHSGHGNHGLAHGNGAADGKFE